MDSILIDLIVRSGEEKCRGRPVNLNGRERGSKRMVRVDCTRGLRWSPWRRHAIQDEACGGRRLRPDGRSLGVWRHVKLIRRRIWVHGVVSTMAHDQNDRVRPAQTERQLDKRLGAL